MSLKRHTMKTKPRRTRDELLQSITRDRALLNDYFQDLATRESQGAAKRKDVVLTATKAPQRDSYDLFFESACISIKSLPPKLAAEAKSRISQIITEFELRAISEAEEAQQHKKELAKPTTQLVKTVRVTNEPLVDTSSGIVYEFQPYA